MTVILRFHIVSFENAVNPFIVFQAWILKEVRELLKGSSN